MLFLKKLHDTNSSFYENCIIYIVVFKKIAPFCWQFWKNFPCRDGVTPSLQTVFFPFFSFLVKRKTLFDKFAAS